MKTTYDFQLSRDAAEQYDHYSYPIMAPFVAALSEYVATGDTVLDLACGTGYMAAEAAARAGDPRRVTGSDVNEAMLSIARRRLDEAIDLVLAPADSTPFDDAQFDTVLCQQGLQFFPDLAAALNEVERILRPGGRLAATVWAQRGRSPYLEAQGRAVEAAIGPATPGAPSGVFSLGAERFTRAALEAGFVEVTVHEVVVDVLLPPLPVFAAQHLAALPFGARIERDAPDSLGGIARAIASSLQDYGTPDGGAKLPFASLLLSARKPQS